MSPDLAVILFTAGVLLIYVELNRPGSILPGCIGLLCTLFAIAKLLAYPITPVSLVCVALAAGLFLLDLRYAMPRWIAGVAAGFLAGGLLILIRQPQGQPHVHTVTAITCSLILGSVTSILTRIARRARANKGLDLERARTSRPGASQS